MGDGGAVTSLEDEVARLRAENAMLVRTVMEVGVAQVEALNAIAKLHGLQQLDAAMAGDQLRVISIAAGKTAEALVELMSS